MLKDILRTRGMSIAAATSSSGPLSNNRIPTAALLPSRAFLPFRPQRHFSVVTSSVSRASVSPLPASPPPYTTSVDTPFRGISKNEFSSDVVFSSSTSTIPIVRHLDYNGELLPGITLPFSLEQGKKMYETMLQVATYDRVFYDIQRQGRISFYMTNNGEEAAQVGSAAAFTNEDPMFPQYRELGALLWRGFTLTEMISQCFGLKEEDGRGRQMPVHYCAQHIGIQAISSPLGTQIPHAAGAGYALRMSNEAKCAVVYFGDGAASEGDFAVALNFAATLKSQTIFICRNNGFAISTPVEEQYRGDGIAVRGLAYGIETIRVDGNDIVATFAACKAAKEKCIGEQRPILIELMTYRGGHHSTSDDASQYRQDEEARCWAEEGLAGIGRFKRYLINQGVWSAEEDVKRQGELRTQCIKALKDAEKDLFVASLDNLFSDVYDKPDWRIVEQQQSLKDHLDKHADKYDLSRIEGSPEFPHPDQQRAAK